VPNFLFLIIGSAGADAGRDINLKNRLRFVSRVRHANPVYRQHSRRKAMMKLPRRQFLQFAGGAAAFSVATTPRAFGAWEPSERYPDPAIKSLDPSFNKYRLFNAGVERLATGTRWGEGPVYFGDARCLIWSDIPNNRLMRYDDVTGTVSIYREPSHHANGNRRDRQGRLVTCEHETRRVTRTEYDGTITVLMDRFEGKRLNSPNDICVKSDDSIWFSDPPFGILNNYQGNVSPIELPSNIYRLDPKTGRATVVEGTLSRPNGVEFSPDETKCYIQDSGSNPRHIYAYDVVGNGTQLANRRVLITAEPEGTPDGFRVDMDGNLWCGWGMGSADLDGVKVFNPEGKLIGFIALPERCANLCFGGRKRNRLFMAASHSLYALYLNAQGTPGN
jgi:gluconolactonase